jgi:formate dehydrogenase major subunit
MPEPIRLQLNGAQVEAIEGESLLELSQRMGYTVPHLCYSSMLRADGNCRACMVEIEGERVLGASCCRKAEAGMVVNTETERVRKAQRGVLELLLSDMPRQRLQQTDELRDWCERFGIVESRFSGRSVEATDDSHPAIQVNLNACINCTRCVRACREAQVNDVIGYAYRGARSSIVFDMHDGLGASSCVGCGECVQACPTGALLSRSNAGVQVDKRVDSLCPYCGVGCQLTYQVAGNRLVGVEGRDGPANHGRLCVKGRYGFDYVHNPQRLTVPLIRRDDVPKEADVEFDPARPETIFREASWEEALDRAAQGFTTIQRREGNAALAGLGSAKGSCEEAYLFQKLVRSGFVNNNVDHCTRLCHASSVAALLEGLGSGAVSNPIRDVEKSDVIIITGANPAVNHPVGASWMKNAIKRGTQLILMDPRESALARFASHHVQFKPASDVALLNAMMHVIIEEQLTDDAFIEARTEGYAELKAHLQAFSPQRMESVCGIDAEQIRTIARLYAKAKNAMILWGMGVSQHVHGTDNARCLIALCMISGQIGRPGTGLHPLRGQNNVQGASDVGLIPMMYPDYQSVSNSENRKKFERFWSSRLSDQPGLTTVEISNAAYNGELKGLYVEGENPAMSDPDLLHVRTALSRLEHLVVQDIFLTETAHYADVVLPASAFPEKTGSFINSDRMVQLGRQAIDPPGQARQDWWIIQEIGNRLGLDWHYSGPQDVFNEMRQIMPSIAGITWQRLQQETVTYPCQHEGDAGNPVIFDEHFPTPDGKARLVPAAIVPPDEPVDTEYPLILITGRQLEHWHTGSMTRRSAVLDALEPEAYVEINPQDAYRLNLDDGADVNLQSRRGRVDVKARINGATPAGSVFMPFCYYEAAANILTNPALDPTARIAEVKYCAVRMTVIA